MESECTIHFLGVIVKVINMHMQFSNSEERTQSAALGNIITYLDLAFICDSNTNFFQQGAKVRMSKSKDKIFLE